MLFPTLAHLTATSTSLLVDWNLNPILLLGILALSVAYWYAVGPLAQRLGETVTTWQIISFTAGTVALALALVSPLDALGDTYLFSAHMVQHMLISVVTPPLWLLGVPGWLAAGLLKGRVRRVARWLGNPIIAFGAFNLDLWLWHFPPFYDATLANEYLHIFEHLTFIALGVLFWWPVLAPLKELRISRGFAVLYLFMGCQPMVALGALLTFAAQPLYQPYVTAPVIWGSTPLGDQQLGGLIMWLPTNIPYVIALSAAFFQWVGDLDHRERAAAGEFDDDVANIPAGAVADAPESGMDAQRVGVEGAVQP
ncbi:MAG: cytochrome c oxidase assembly protein [Ktedonobacterales bacterium]